MNINKDTQVCISIAERPGNFGSNIFNAGFKAMSLDFIYKPFKVLESELENSVKGIRAFNIRGCGVSMPHKVKVMSYLDYIDPVAEKIGAINTIVNNQGILSGYNTDFVGAKKVLAEFYDVRAKKALIIGAGGVSRAIIMALKESGASEIFLTNRDESKGKKVAQELNLEYCAFDKKADLKVDLLINATSVGMSPLEKETILDRKFLRNYHSVMDVIIYPPETLLMSNAKKEGKVVIPGYKMALYQAMEQFRLYTGQEPPLDMMLWNINNFLNNQARR